MALAAIASDDVYNFGEVLSTPILNTLQNTPNRWYDITNFIYI